MEGELDARTDIESLADFFETPNIIKIVPANRLDNGGPSFDFVRCI